MPRLVPPALFAICAVTTSCGREQGPPRDARGEAAASAAQRLQGRWLLQSFQPTTQLDFAMQSLLNAQIGRIDEAYGEHLQMMVFDSYGVGFRAMGDFAGNTLIINGIDAPWVGRGTMVRLP
jgi:hypothetical protein